MDFDSYKFNNLVYLERLAALPTQADPKGVPPETLNRFMDCANYIADMLKEFGLVDVEVTDKAYVYATIPATKDNVPVIALMAHFDTALENTGEGTSMIIHNNYKGGDITLPHGDVVIPAGELSEKIGHDIVTGSGDNQLGADDKTGVVAIMDAARYLVTHPEIPHGTIKLIFNHNEEVGRGIEFLDYDKLGADYGYCVDAGVVGKLFQENFNAEAVTLTVTGVTEHPGYAKGKMVNALFVADEIISELRNSFKSPEDSEGREPYLGLNSVEGTWTKASLHYILRGFEKSDVKEMKDGIEATVVKTFAKYPKISIESVWDSDHRYENSSEVLAQSPLVNEMAEKAYAVVGVEVVKDLTRGGFDGVKMSFDGLPTTNIFNAAMNMHGLNEWTTRQDMELVVKMIVNLCHLWGKK